MMKNDRHDQSNKFSFLLIFCFLFSSSSLFSNKNSAKSRGSFPLKKNGKIKKLVHKTKNLSSKDPGLRRTHKVPRGERKHFQREPESFSENQVVIRSL